MHREAMRPFGLALRAYRAGREEAELVLRRDDGLETPLPVVTAIDLNAEACRIMVDRGVETVIHKGGEYLARLSPRAA